jgi:DNA replication and repair protein RecF
MTPAMDRLFAETPGARRRFLDRLVLALHPGHARETTRYDAAMRARGRLLAQETPADPAWLAALEAAMAEHGAAVAAARAATVAALAEAILASDDGAFPRASIALSGNDPGPDFAAELARRRAADAAAGRATLGPHRADLVVAYGGREEPAARASTGEQKALLAGIVLAHAALVAARTGRPPILLLDEIAAHFDAGRRAALYDRLAASGAQTWMTGADPALFDGVGGTWLELARGG